jgi:diguanylate cyclase (GGDEF)-like protein/PAS domain S-box-containing protein
MLNTRPARQSNGRNRNKPGGGRGLIETIAAPVIAVRHDGTISFFNAAAARLLDVSAQRAVGRRWSEVVALRDVAGRISTSPPPMESDAAEWWFVKRRDGSEVPVQLSVAHTEHPARPGDGETSVVLHELTGVYALMERLLYRCAHDDLTGLVNRAEFEKRLKQAIDSARAGYGAHALLYMDLNGFKAVNDRHGHLAGDDVLRQVSSRMFAVVRTRDTLARLGGDEFALLMEHCTVSAAMRTARLLRLALLRAPLHWNGNEISVGISIGVVAVATDSGDCDSVMTVADAACYTAKRRGNNSIRAHFA